MKTCLPILCLWFAPVLGTANGAANAQNVVVTSSSGQTMPLVPHPAVVTFVASDSKNLQGATKNGAISGVGTSAATTVAAKAIPVPIVGGIIAGQAIGGIGKMFHKGKPILGFNVALVQGLSAGTDLPAGAMSFTVPAQSLQGASPLLLRLKLSEKDSARIVRGVHLSTKPTGSATNLPNSKILGIDQDAVACGQEIRNGDVVLIPKSPLQSGEYAIVLVSAQPDRAPVAGTVLWDFRLL
jgi:hypothetical protein